MNIAVAIMMLGYTRTQGVVAYNTELKSFDLVTPAKAKKMIDEKKMRGICWKYNDDRMLEFYPDLDGWNQKDIMILSGLTYRPMINDVPGLEVMNTMYSVSKIINEKNAKKYEVVSNTFQRLTLTDEQMRGLAEITVVAGVSIEGDQVEACEGLIVEQVENVENKKTQATKKTSTRKKVEKDKPSNNRQKAKK